MKVITKTVELQNYVDEYCKMYNIDLDKIDRSQYDYSGAIKMYGMYWKPIDCDGYYLISDFGLIYNFDRHKFLKPQRASQRGYYQVKLTFDGKRKCKYVHRLVLDAFFPNWENKPQGNHLDEIHSNNCLYNIAWCTNKENANYGNRNENISKSLKDYWATILTPAEMENSHFN